MVTGGILSDIIGYVIYGSIGLSTLITLGNNASSNSRIRRKGYKIKSIFNNSIFENIKYFIKDYLVLLIPGVNIIRAIKAVAKKDSEFDSERIALLTDRDRLEKIKKEEPAKKEPEKAKEPEPKKEAPTTSRTPSVRLNPRRGVTEPVAAPEAEMTCYERRDALRNEYYRLRDLHARAKAAGRSVTDLNAVVAQMKVIIGEYQKAERECTIQDLKAERSAAVSAMGRPTTLRRL